MAGVSRLRAEAASFGESLGSAADVMQSEITRDIFRARQFAANYARAWFGAASSAGDSVKAAANEASKTTAWQIRRLAVTESAEALNTGRAKYLGQSQALGLLRVWDAVLDKRTCPICSALDGLIVGARERFPHGDPPVHGHCRCSWQLLTPSEAGGITTYEPNRVAVVDSPLVPRAPVVRAPTPIAKPKPITAARRNPAPSTEAVKDYKRSAKITREFIADGSPEARALSRYVATSAPVNQYMRDRAAGGAIDEAAEAEIAKIKSAMRSIRERGGALSGTVMRGESVTAERFAELSAAPTLNYPSFVSSTISPKEAEAFSRYTKHQVLISIENAHGIPLGGIGSHGGSREVLLEPGAFRVLSRRLEGNRLHLTVTR